MVASDFSSLKINPEAGKEIALTLFRKFNSTEGIFGHHTMPEDLLPRWGSDLTASGIKRGSYEQLMFVTMVVSIDYQRNADQLWAAGRKTFEDEATRWLFYPDKIQPENAKASLQKYKLSKKPKKDARIWLTVSSSFRELYDSNPLNLLSECNYDALKIYRKKLDRTFKQAFPYFSGDKIYPLWIRMLNDNVGISLRNIDQIPIPVDIHTARATFATGCLMGQYRGNISAVAPKIDESWKAAMALINDNQLKYRLQLDEPLWHLSRYGCTNRKGNACFMKARCPVGQLCTQGIVNVSAKEVEINTGRWSASNTSLDKFGQLK